MFFSLDWIGVRPLLGYAKMSISSRSVKVNGKKKQKNRVEIKDIFCLVKCLLI